MIWYLLARQYKDLKPAQQALRQPQAPHHAGLFALGSGSSQLTGDGHLSNTVEYSIPTTVCQDAQSVILALPN